MDTTSYWRATQGLPRFPKLDRDVTVDVAVVGAGITGVTTAYLLKQAGLKVLLVDRDRCGGVDTAYTSGHLTQVTDLRLHQLVDRFSGDHARAVWDAGGAALDRIYALQSKEEIECGFRWVPAFLFDSLEEEFEDSDGLKEDSLCAAVLELPAWYRESAPPFGGAALQFSPQALFHPLKYLRGLLQRIPGDGCQVCEGTEITELSTTPPSLAAGPHRIHCDWVVLATQTPQVGSSATPRAELLQSKLARYTSYVLSAHLPADQYPEGLYWDTANPYHYLRIERRRGYSHLILGGEDHKTGQEAHPTQAYQRLERKMKTWFPSARIDHRWSGQVVETHDGLPCIGALDDRLFVATGFAGNGLTFGTLSAIMAADTLRGVVNPWSHLFDPHRTVWRTGAWNYLKENKDYPYYLIRDWTGRSEPAGLVDLKPGQGRIVGLTGRKMAAYRDEHGTITLCSPVCPHLKCIVAWNDAEHTWDCPCHGSRFQATGEVMAGPAQANLEKIEVIKASAAPAPVAEPVEASLV